MKLTRLPENYLVIDAAALLDAPDLSGATELFTAVRRTARAGRDIRAAVVSILKERGALLETAKYVIIDDQPPKSLPQDKVKYKDRRRNIDLANLNPIDFLKSQYSDFISHGTLYQHQLAEVDPHLLKAVRNYALRRPELEPELKRILKTRYEFARERVEIDAAAAADEELKRDIKSMAYNLNKAVPSSREPR